MTVDEFWGPDGWTALNPAEQARAEERQRVAMVHRLTAADLAAAGYVVELAADEPDAQTEADPSAEDLGLTADRDEAGQVAALVGYSQAAVEARGELERSQTVEVKCWRCGHGWSAHWSPAPYQCAQGMRDGADCSCPGWAWVDPAGRSQSYGDAR